MFCKIPPKTATSEVLNRKLRNAENRAEQLASNVQKTTETLQKQRDSLLDAEEEVQTLSDELKKALRNEGYEKAPLPVELLSVPEHLEEAEKTLYQESLDALEASRLRHVQEAAAITGKLQAFKKAPEPTPPTTDPNAMDTRETGTHTGKVDAPPEKEPEGADAQPSGAAAQPKPDDAKPAPPEEAEAKKARRAKAQLAADLRIEQVTADAANKKHRVGENVDINVDRPEDDL